MKKTTLIILFSLIGIFSFAQDDFIINDFDVTIDLDKSGGFKVTEEIDLTFSEKRHGIYRDIPLKGNFEDFSQYIKISDIKVNDFNRKISRTKSKVSIRIGNPKKYVNGRQKYTISYYVKNGILNFQNHQEFYWNIIDSYWKQKIQSSHFTIHLPDDLNITEEDVVAYSGAHGTKAKFVSFDISGNTIEGESLTTLGAGKGMSLAIKAPNAYFPISQIKETKSEPKIPKEYPKDYYYLLPLALLSALVYYYRKFGSNRRRKASSEELYFPTNDMSPAEVGYFYDHYVNERDIISLIPYWGEQGIISMRIDHNDEVHLIKEKSLPHTAPNYEFTFFNALFAAGDDVLIEEAKYDLSEAITTIRSEIKSEVSKRPLYDEEAQSFFRNSFWIITSLCSLFAGIGLMIGFRFFITGGICILTGLFGLVLSIKRPRLTNKGELIKLDLIRLHRTLKNPSQDRMSQILNEDPKYLDKIFPYVVAFGLDKKWSKKFKKFFDKGPDWMSYENGSPLYYSDFGRHYNTNSINSSITPKAPESGSGFSGGGSVGGGFGGGGGGSW